ncbi:MAG: hypothetical protein WCO55_05235 [Candidatus Falkowbacteria bacterium]
MINFEKLIAQPKPNERQVKWDQLTRDIEKTVDSLGYQMDAGIKYPVIALKANDFDTTASCEGHSDHSLPWPWVDVQARASAILDQDPAFTELKKKADAARQNEVVLAPEEQLLVDQMMTKIKSENEKEYQRLSKYLDEFYQAEYKVDPQTKLYVHKMGANRGRLEPTGAHHRIKANEAQLLWATEEKERNLKAYRQEMDRFAEFLKHKFLSGDL